MSGSTSTMSTIWKSCAENTYAYARFIIDSFCILISSFFLYKSLITLLGFLGWERGSTEVQKYSPSLGQASETERVSAFFRALS